jgi:hypothetical protein
VRWAAFLVEVLRCRSLSMPLYLDGIQRWTKPNPRTNTTATEA